MRVEWWEERVYVGEWEGLGEAGVVDDAADAVGRATFLELVWASGADGACLVVGVGSEGVGAVGGLTPPPLNVQGGGGRPPFTISVKKGG